MTLLVGNTENPADSKRPHLRLVSSDEGTAAMEPLERDVRAARREMARLLRALQASGQSITTWASEVVTRLAHLDAVTARHLIDGRGTPLEVRQAVQGLRAIEAWICDGLTPVQRADVRAFELVIRIEDAELTQPLLQPDGAPEETMPSVALGRTMPPRSLRTGLRALDDEGLAELARRLGVRPLDIEPADADKARAHLESTILSTLRDDHLLAILLSTLRVDAQRMLADLVRGRFGPGELEDLAQPTEVATAVGSDVTTVPGPVDTLRACGLAFSSGRVRRASVWVPVELQPRIDGVLRGLGL